MATQKDIKSRISSVKNIRKITRAMEMVAAARLRRAEQRIEELRPYAEAIRKMTRRAVEAAESIPSLPILEEHDSINRVGLLLVTGDRGLAPPAGARARGQEARLVRVGPPRCLVRRVPRLRARGRLHGIHRPARIR